MSGVEIAGLVLGGFPIIVQCLQHYKAGLEPLDEWYHFQDRFIDFIHSIRHQEMKYRKNVVELLQPIVPSDEELHALLASPSHTRWTDGSLEKAFQERLGSEHDRFLRTIRQMGELMKGLEKLLQIDQGKFDWIGQSDTKPWIWHLQRLQLSFRKGKTRKVDKLAECNLILEEILSYTDKVAPILHQRSLTSPVRVFNKLKDQACVLYQALESRWICGCREPNAHEAHLQLGAEPQPTATANFNVRFSVIDRSTSAQTISLLTVIKATREPSTGTSNSQTSLQKAAGALDLVEVQQKFENAYKQKTGTRSQIKSIFTNPFSSSHSKKGKAAVKPSPLRPGVSGKQAPPSIKICPPPQSHPVLGSGNQANQKQTPVIDDLCSVLQTCGSSTTVELGVIKDDHDRYFQICRSATANKSDPTFESVTFLDIIRRHHDKTMMLTRNDRFSIAANVASALLLVVLSPWLSLTITREAFRLWIQNKKLASDVPFVAHCFKSVSPQLRQHSLSSSPLATSPSHSVAVLGREEVTRRAFQAIGIMILELIFGTSITDCKAYRTHLLPSGQQGPFTELNAAQDWRKDVQGECGDAIDEVVRRCLDCSFGPRPDLGDKRFREAVYEQVIEPLLDYRKPWTMGPTV